MLEAVNTNRMCPCVYSSGGAPSEMWGGEMLEGNMFEAVNTVLDVLPHLSRAAVLRDLALTVIYLALTVLYYTKTSSTSIECSIVSSIIIGQSKPSRRHAASGGACVPRPYSIRQHTSAYK